MFGLNNAQLIGRLGADVTVNQPGQRRQGRKPLDRHRRELHRPVSCFMMHLVGTVRSIGQI